TEQRDLDALPYAQVDDVVVPEPVKRVLHRSPLRIEDRAFEHDVDDGVVVRLGGVSVIVPGPLFMIMTVRLESARLDGHCRSRTARAEDPVGDLLVRLLHSAQVAPEAVLVEPLA